MSVFPVVPPVGENVVDKVTKLAEDIRTRMECAED